MLRCTSSASSDQSNVPRAISARIVAQAALRSRRGRALRDHAAGGEHARVRERAADVVLRQALVEGDRGGVALHDAVHRLGEAARPRLALLALPGCRCGHGD